MILPSVHHALLAARAPAIVALEAYIYGPVGLPAYAKYVASNFAGFSIELSDWPQYAGSAVGQPNTYIRQLLSNLQDQSGGPPPIRVGGSSENGGVLDSSIQISTATFPNATSGTPYPGSSSVNIGQDFYALSGNLAAGTE